MAQEMNIKKLTVKLYTEGYSCSEAMVKAASELKLINKTVDPEFLIQIASSFSGGMSSGCLCGAAAGAQIVIGSMFGRKDKNVSPKEIKEISKDFVDRFKEKRKVTCCKALTAGFDFSSPERRQNCIGIVEDASEILEELINEHSLFSLSC